MARCQVVGLLADTSTIAAALPTTMTMRMCWLWLLPPILGAWVAQTRPVGTFGLICAWVALWALASKLHPQRQFLHDALAGTQLVSITPAPMPASSSTPTAAS